MRILPPYYIAIALLYAASFFVPWVNHVSLYDVVRQALFLDNGTKFLTGSFWTLPIEFRWYFFFPVGLYLWVRYPKALVLMIARAGADRSSRPLRFTMDVLLSPGLPGWHHRSGDTLQAAPTHALRLPDFVLLLAALSFRPGNPHGAHTSLAGGGLSTRDRGWLTGVVAQSAFNEMADDDRPRIIQYLSRAWPGRRLCACKGLESGRCRVTRYCGRVCVFLLVAVAVPLKGPLRSNLIAQFEEFPPRWFATLGLNRSFRLGAPSVVADHVARRVGAGHN